MSTATQSLNAVAASEGEKLVTLYLSPGTPVMAFVWAFAALRHPMLKNDLSHLPSQEDLRKESTCRTSGWNGTEDRFEQPIRNLISMMPFFTCSANSGCRTCLA